jgi:hypothetical protein
MSLLPLQQESTNDGNAAKEDKDLVAVLVVWGIVGWKEDHYSEVLS